MKLDGRSNNIATNFEIYNNRNFSNINRIMMLIYDENIL